MIERYKEIDICLFNGLKEYYDILEIEPQFEDEEGNKLEIDYDDLECYSKEHFTDDSTYKIDNVMWEAWHEPELGYKIILILLNDIKEINYSELIRKMPHEYGHIVNGDNFKNSIAAYDTDEGYAQEESKAMAFEDFFFDAYKMVIILEQMLIKNGIKIIR